MKKMIVLFLLFILCGCNINSPSKNEITHKVDFYYDKQIQHTVKVKDNDKISEITPTKDGYIFDGWYVDYDYKEEFNFDTNITYSMTLYGKFLKLCKVYFDDSYVEVIEGNTVDKPENPIKDGYTFDGWLHNNISFDFNSKIYDDIYLISNWYKENLIVSFETFGGTIIEDVYINHSNKISKPIDPIKNGYRFDNWYLDLNQDIVFDFNTPIVSDLTLYANFIKTYTITLEDVYNFYDNIIVDENSTINNLPTPSKTGYKFLGWFLNSQLFDKTSTINSDLTLVAKWEKVEIENMNINITFYDSYNEGLFVEFEKVDGFSNISDYQIYYKNILDSNYISLDKNLIQENNNSIRFDILGLVKGTYEVKIKVNESECIISNITVENHDRSGYAHFNYSQAIGGYNNDGSVKDDAIIIYVTENNKNSVTASFNGKTYVGLADILKNASKCTNPLIIRIIGTITAATWKPINYSGKVSVKDKSGNVVTKSLNEDEIISLGINELNITENITKLNGLTNKLSYSNGEYDSNFNMLYIENGKNITIEGVGVNAMLFQWGLCFKNCNNIEVRNLTFDDYTEDACSFEGKDTSALTLSEFNYGRYWIHNNTFNEGINYWDVTTEQDKHEGDGATDFKGVAYVTISYNHYYKNHKTGLVGGSDNQTSACFTFHHNYYDSCSSRLPLGRRANMHMYNNYYYNITGTTMSIRATGYAFIENCVFESCNNPMSTTGDGAIKSYNNKLINCSGKNSSSVVELRTDPIINNNTYDMYFDTNINTFYYDSVNKISNVSNLLPTNSVKDYVVKNTGVLKSDFKLENNKNDNKEKIVLTFNDFTSGDITSTTTKNNITINPKTDKTCKINNCTLSIENTTITKYINLGGVGTYDSLSIQFITTNKANITVYYSSSGSTERFVKLMTSNESFQATTPTIPKESTIVSHTFYNVEPNYLAVGSYNSGINIYCIIIEYVN